MKIIGGVLVILAIGGQGWAFDGDYEINLPDFQSENFLDIKSYQLSPQLEAKWHETANGLRIVGGSIGVDFLYLTTEIRVKQSLNRHVAVKYHLKREEFYAIKPLRQQVALELRFLENYAIAAIGFPAYDKRVAEQGVAFTWGRAPWHYLRFFHLQQAPYYNEKNFAEDYFLKEPVENGVEGAYRIENWSARFRWVRDAPLAHYFPQQQLMFRYQGEEADFVLEYHPARPKRWGLAARGFDVEKSRRTPTGVENEEHQQQNLQYLATDFYWVGPILPKHTLTLGTRYDRLRNLLRQLRDSNRSFDYQFDTWQIYGTWLQPAGSGWNLDYGLYLGHSYEGKNYLTATQKDSLEEGFEAKARVSLELYNVKNEGHLFFTTTWNADDFFNNFWDGGNIAYQTQF